MLACGNHQCYRDLEAYVDSEVGEECDVTTQHAQMYILKVVSIVEHKRCR